MPRVKVYTALYHYKGADRLDVTVKGNDPVGRFFAPTWGMVKALKRGHFHGHPYSEQDYADQFMARMRQSYKHHYRIWQGLLARDSVTLVCFCSEFCHRHILSQIFNTLGAQVLGERDIKL